MKKAVWLLPVAAMVLILTALWIRTPSVPEASPPRPSAPNAPSPVPPAPPPPSIPVAPKPSESSEEALLQRWRAAIRGRNSKDVLDLQSTFLGREGEYQEPLMKMSRDDAEPRVRAFSVAVLGRMKTPPPESYFLERTQDANEYPRVSAVEALEKLGTAACLGTADRLAAGDPVEAVRAAAARTAKAVRSR